LAQLGAQGLLQRGGQQVRFQREIARGNAVVETERVPGFRTKAKLRGETVFEKANVRAIKKRIAAIGIKSE
jgi:hypothetical protein